MKDFNFFSSYSKKKAKSFNIDYLLYAFTVLLLIAMINYGIFNYISIRRLNAQIAGLEKQVDEKKEDTRIKNILKKEEEIKSFKDSIIKLKILDEYIDRKDIVNGFLFDEVENNLPSKVFLKTMVLTPDNIRIEGKSQDKESIAQFQHNLDKLDAFGKVFVQRIIHDGSHYSFSLDITFKEEKDDGAETEKQ